MGRRVVSEAERNQVVGLLRQIESGELTLTATEISQRAGVSVSYVTTIGRDLSIRFRATGRPKALDHDEVFALLDQGISQADIARKLSTTPQAISQIIRRRKLS